MTSEAPNLRELYEERARQHRKLRDHLARRSLHISNLRGLMFVIAAGAAGFATFGHAGKLGVALSVAAGIAFIVLVVRHARVIEAQALQDCWGRVNDDAVSRITGDNWHSLPQAGVAFRDPLHPYTDDLDIFGRGSLFQRLCVAQTHMGQARLAQLLAGAADLDQLQQRQALVKVLAPQIDLRQEFEVLGLATREVVRKGQELGAPSDLTPLLHWGESPSKFPKFPWLTAVIWAAPILTTTSAVLCYLGKLPFSLAMAPLLVHLLALVKTRPHTRSVIEMLVGTERTVINACPLFELLETRPDLASITDQLRSGPHLPSRALKRLQRIAGWFELRHNGLIYPFVNLFLLWDIHCTMAFERWKQQYGQHLRPWFGAIGEMEAVSSLAGLYHDEPDSCFAEIVTDGCGLEATALGHPLINRDTRVTNDVMCLKQGYGLLVTGSNMSGKSTYLRAVGLGAVMGLAGGPVCARRLRMAPVYVATSMRISDSLASGVSHFYAELQKLKRVLEASTRRQSVLFLLDEILHGTNSRERQLGARHVLSELLRANAFGAVSTHDLALCELSGDLSERLTMVHFRESLDHDDMTFDFRIYPGPVTSGNALRLMRSLGIMVPIEGE